jgi:uncharacterized RDD family membrane protein YckC
METNPSTQPVAAQATTQASATTLNLADSTKRIIAGILDGAVFFILYWIVSTIISAIFGVASSMSFNKYSDFSTSDLASVFAGNLVVSLLLGLIFVGWFFAYYILVPSKLFPGQTLGKKLLGLRVASEAGAPVDMNLLVKRHSVGLGLAVGYAIPCVNILVCCAFPIYAIVLIVKVTSDPKRKTIGDNMAGTVVVEA